MKKIDISTKKFPNTFALVDDSDYEELNQYKWHAAESRRKRYVVRGCRIDGKQTAILMHIAIMGKVDGKEIDRRNSDGLDNQRKNLRHCKHVDNLTNTGPQKNNTSGYKGVTWNSRDNKWQAYVKHNSNQIHLGQFFCLIKAAKCYDQAALKYHGEFAWLNFPILQSNGNLLEGEVS